MNVWRRIRYLIGLWLLMSAKNYMARGHYKEASEILNRISLPDGPRQIALVQLANCYINMHEYLEAQNTYTRAITAEMQWSGRVNKKSSEYIVGYAEFFRSVVFEQCLHTSGFDNIDLYDKLLLLDAPRKLKSDLLPLPSRSLVRTKKLGMESQSFS